MIIIMIIILIYRKTRAERVVRRGERRRRLNIKRDVRIIYDRIIAVIIAIYTRQTLHYCRV